MLDRARIQPRGAVPRAVLASLALFLAAVLGAPLVALAVEAASRAAELGRALASAEALYALGMSLVLAAVALAVNGVLGVVGGIALARHRFFGRGLVDAMLDLPLAVSPVMIGLACFVLLGREGWAAPALDAIGLKVAFAVPGLVLATVFVTLPFTAREVALVVEEIGDQEEQAAATLGAGPVQTFFRVTLPNLRSGLEVGAVLTAARALGEFGAVLVIGGAISRRTETATTYIHGALEERDLAGAYGMALVLGAASVALMVLLRSRRARAGS